MIRVAINGFGRIGRVFLRVAMTKPNIEIVAINDLAPPSTLAHLLKYDSIHRRFPGEVSCEGDNIVINGTKIPVFAAKDPLTLPWKQLNVDVVIESTGKFTSKVGGDLHIVAGAKKVIISAPPHENDVKTVVLG